MNYNMYCRLCCAGSSWSLVSLVAWLIGSFLYSVCIYIYIYIYILDWTCRYTSAATLSSSRVTCRDAKQQSLPPWPATGAGSAQQQGGFAMRGSAVLRRFKQSFGEASCWQGSQGRCKLMGPGRGKQPEHVI